MLLLFLILRGSQRTTNNPAIFHLHIKRVAYICISIEVFNFVN